MTTKTVRLSLNVLTAMMLWPGLFAGLVRAADAPKIQFDRTIQDLGIVIEGEVPGGKFVFQNTGTGVLELSKPETSCGCTVATVKPEKLAPGEKGEISFTLDLTNMRGPTEKSITVPSNDPETPQALLLIKADIKPIFEFSPEI